MYFSKSHPNQLVFGGEIVGESAIEFEQQIGLEVKHTFEVTFSHECFLYTRPSISPYEYACGMPAKKSIPVFNVDL